MRRGASTKQASLEGRKERKISARREKNCYAQTKKYKIEGGVLLLGEGLVRQRVQPGSRKKNRRGI